MRQTPDDTSFCLPSVAEVSLLSTVESDPVFLSVDQMKTHVFCFFFRSAFKWLLGKGAM